jgi:large subunit ribosomal protein L13
MKSEPLEKLLKRAPEQAIERAVKGMLPHTSLGRQMFKKLKVVRGADHPHQAQQPITLEI